MSGYNAEYTAPRDEELEDLGATLPPIVLKDVEEVEEKTLPVQMRHLGLAMNSEHSQQLFDLAFEVSQELAKLEALTQKNEELVESLRQSRFGDIQPHDHRLAHIWERAGEIADSRGYCDVFDSIMEELGTGYTREMEYCVTVTETKTYDVHVTGPRNATQHDIELLIDEVRLDDYAETDSEIEVTNYESAD
jgi:hypothetical protein